MDCTTIISGTVRTKSNNSFLARFHNRHAVLVFVYCSPNERRYNNYIKSNIENGFYELRFYKNKTSEKIVSSFEIDPQSMTCEIYEKVEKSKKKKSKNKKYSFICTSHNSSYIFTTATFTECNAWMSVFKQLQWQYNLPSKQPCIPKKAEFSNTLSSELIWMSATEYNSYISLKKNASLATNYNIHDSSTTHTHTAAYTIDTQHTPSYNSLPIEPESKNNESSHTSTQYYGILARDSMSYSSPPLPENVPAVDINDEYSCVNNTCMANAVTDEIRKYYCEGNLWRDNDLYTVENTGALCECKKCSKNARYTIIGLLDEPKSVIDSVEEIMEIEMDSGIISPSVSNSTVTKNNILCHLECMKSPNYSGIAIADSVSDICII